MLCLYSLAGQGMGNGGMQFQPNDSKKMAFFACFFLPWSTLEEYSYNSNVLLYCDALII
jgi:hypothetical protein